MKYLVLLAFSFFLVACGSNSTPGPVKDISLSGFQIDNIPGTDHNRAIRYGTNGQILEEGTLVNGKRHGQWINYHPQNSASRIKVYTNYINGRKNGVELEFNARGQIEKKSTYLNDQFHGLVASYKFGRPIEETNYKEGQFHGLHRTYYQRGEVQQEVEFKNGKQDGTFRYFDEQGNVTLEYTYKNGKKLSGGMKSE